MIKTTLLVLLLASLLLSGCARLGIAANPGGSNQACLGEDPGTKSFVNEAHGYCLLYPSGYDLGEPNENEIALYVGSLLDVEHPKTFIDVQDADGRSTEQVVDEIIADLAGIDIQRDNMEIDGETAIVLDGVPGQDSSRQVVFTHAGKVYRLTFFPGDESYGEIYNQMQQVYKTVTRSFRFLP